MQRYLMNVSYIGTQFRGVQKIVNYNEPFTPDPTTIQGALEIALCKLKSANEPLVTVSSRTDTGVHALNSAFHVDLLRSNQKPYEPEGITTTLNKYFYKKNIQIRVLKTRQVSNSFHCRYHAKSRTYLYRLAVLKQEHFHKPNMYMYHIPIEEYSRCHFLCFPNFDMDKMHIASRLFLGLHDFRTFMGKSSHFLHKNTRRTLQKLELIKGMPASSVESCDLSNIENLSMYDYWNVVCKSEGFLYNQVRRIVGTLIAAGQGKVTPGEIRCMLQVPSHLSWNPRIVPAPSHGLYLCQVEYSPDDLKAACEILQV